MGKFGSQKGTVNLASFDFGGLAGNVYSTYQAACPRERKYGWVVVVRRDFMELWVGVFPFSH